MNEAAASREEAFTFDCEGETLLGLLHHPAPGAAAETIRTGVVVIVGGPQYRAGSHRQFVHLARALAAAGHPVLRFDVRGMGDSTGALRDFEQITADVTAAVDALVQRAPAVQRVVLWGLCDGASAALLHLHETADVRVQGLCLLNPWIRSEASLARTHVKHYYTRRLREKAFWAKLLSGRVAWRALSDVLANLRRARTDSTATAPAQPPFQTRMATAWHRFDGRLLLVLSGEDYTAKEFIEYTAADVTWRPLLARRTVSRHELANADHTLSARADREAMNSVTLRWLRELA